MTPSDPTPLNIQDSQAQALDRKTLLATLYLALPLALFLGGWFIPLVSVTLLVMLGLGLRHALRPAWAGTSVSTVAWTGTVGLMVVAVAWCSLGGAGHLFFANSDWTIRDAVLRDLSATNWPPSYGQLDGYAQILRAPVGYYLPAATLAHWLGIDWADRLLLLWTILGVGLFLNLLPLSSLPLRWALGVACVVLFSGMDILGGRLFYGSWPPPGSHIEWWAALFQYSSHSTQLFWVPNHALPAWLAMALFFRHWRHPDFLRLAPMLMALLPLWSPFAAIGMSPFYMLLLPAAFKTGWRFFHPANLGPALLLLGVQGLYLTLDLASVPAGSQLGQNGLDLDFMILYGAFCMLEFLLLGLALYRDGKGPLLIVAMLTLCVLPFFKMGPGNDLVMRSSIPALMLLCLLFLQSLQNPRLRLQDLAGTGVILLIGALTPLQEIYRAMTLPTWAFRPDRTLIQAADGQAPPHYVARLNPGLLQSVMRTPVLVTPK